MQEKSWTNIDRAGWPKGPWDDEPDKVQFQDAATGLPCLAVRTPHLGQWCGYVGVPPGHPWHGKDFMDEAVDANVHGGLTFSAGCDDARGEGHGICHIPDPGEPDDVWWFGFDCAHAWDKCPGMDARHKALGRVFDDDDFMQSEYRTLDYVRAQCEKLAAQLKAVNPEEPSPAHDHIAQVR